MTGNEVDLEDRRRWGIHATRSVPRLLVTELSRLLALTGPTVIAIDQIDALIDELVGQGGDAGRSPGARRHGTGLMTLRDRSFRTLTIVSPCRTAGTRSAPTARTRSPTASAPRASCRTSRARTSAA